MEEGHAPEREWISVSEATVIAAALGNRLSDSTIYKLIERGDVVGDRISPRHVLVYKPSLISYLKALTVPAQCRSLFNRLSTAQRNELIIAEDDTLIPDLLSYLRRQMNMQT